MMRVGLYRPRSQKFRMLLTDRKLLQWQVASYRDRERFGALRNFGLKVGIAGRKKVLTRPLTTTSFG